MAAIFISYLNHIIYQCHHKLGISSYQNLVYSRRYRPLQSQSSLYHHIVYSHNLYI